MEKKTQTIVFVHGAWHGAWCWDEWLEYFRSLGYNAVAVELRGHGYKAGEYDNARLKNYLADIKLFVDEFTEPPILVGHSLGCSIVQHLIADQEFPAAVLVAPIPEAKLFKRVFVEQLAQHPLLALQSIANRNMKPWIAKQKRASLFFSNELDPSQASQFLNRMQGESFRVFLLDLMKRVPLKKSHTPVLVIGAEKDAFFSLKAQRQTATTIGADFLIAYNAGHDVMLDVTQQQVAQEIGLWLDKSVTPEKPFIAPQN